VGKITLEHFSLVFSRKIKNEGLYTSREHAISSIMGRLQVENIIGEEKASETGNR
jgi:hypothetical protein